MTNLSTNPKTSSASSNDTPVGPSSYSLSKTDALIIEHALAALQPISRTFQGISDTSTSGQKMKLALEGDSLKAKIAENFRNALRFLLACRDLEIKDVEDVRRLFDVTVNTLNDGLVQHEQGRWRTWNTNIPGHSKPEQIDTAMESFYAEFQRRFNDQDSNAIEFAAWVEKRLNAEIHPLSDGCGRVSKALATFILARDGYLYPTHKSRDEYYSKINLPLREWGAYCAELTQKLK